MIRLYLAWTGILIATYPSWADLFASGLPLATVAPDGDGVKVRTSATVLDWVNTSRLDRAAVWMGRKEGPTT